MSETPGFPAPPDAAAPDNDPLQREGVLQAVGVAHFPDQPA